MSIDSTELAQLVAKLMDDLDDAGIDGEIVDALIVLEIDDGEMHLTRLKCSSDRGIIGSGLAHTAARLYDASIDVEPGGNDD